MEKEPERIIDTNQLETKHRDFLQIALVKEVLGDNSMTEQRNEFFEKNAEKISGIIDSDTEEVAGIRKLARDGKYEEAAKLLKDLL